MIAPLNIFLRSRTCGWTVVVLLALAKSALCAEIPFLCDAVEMRNPPIADGHFRTAGSSPASALGVKRLLIYRVDFSDAVGAAISSNAAATLISDLNGYYRDMSYGLMTFSLAQAGSVVTETLRLPEPSTAYDNNFIKLIDATRQVAATAGYAAGAFDFDVVCTGAKPFSVFGGQAYVGGPGVWIANGNFNLGVVGHELGHNLGLPHASFWFTGEQSSIGPGTLQQYGDLFDSMGVPGGSSSHFHARFKHFLGWIPDANAPFITANGMYRITAHDQAAAAGRRALRLERDNELNYWVEFRQSFNNRWVTNGASLRWSWNNATNTLLLDTTPGTALAAQDSPVLIGRTFSDGCIDLHITPVGKGGTSPESLDVVVNRGPFPGNVPPVVTIAVSATNTAPATAIMLDATASDANGDALAYFWDFGDGNFGRNQSSISYAWATAGEYVARCTVTDMKGGTASASVVVRVGTVATFMVSGQISMNGRPVEGVLVKAGTRFSYTDSDGTYRISRLAAGRPVVSAALERFNFFNAGFENPPSVGPSATGLNFVGLSDALNGITLVATGSVWRYLDTGAVPAGDWKGLAYDDSGWKSGPARLGYGVGGEATTVSFGPDASNRYVATWFRHCFTVSDASAVDHLVFRLRRDDGLVVYLNGSEVFRENLPVGTIQPTTTALADVLPAEELVYFKRLIPSSTLLTGTNILAVELHQSRTNSTDLSFDLELSGLTEDPQTFRPGLSVQPSGNDLLVSWPGELAGWSLYGAGELAPVGDWSRVTAGVISSNGMNAVRQFPTNAAGFYRLSKPSYCLPFQ